jgi:hypothetical protein
MEIGYGQRTVDSHLEHRAAAIGSAAASRAVEIAIRPFSQPGIRGYAGILIQRERFHEHSVGGHFENGAVPIGSTFHRGTVKNPIRGLQQTAVRIARGHLESMNRLELHRLGKR